jgi:hypothetical protein
MSNTTSRARPRCYETAIADGYSFRLLIRRNGDFSGISDLFGTLLFGQQEVVGVFTGAIVHLAEPGEEPLAYAMDSHSSGLGDCYGELLMEGKCLDEYAQLGDSDLLHLERLRILKPHRGRGLGNLVLASVLVLLCRSCEVAVLKPFPLQCSGALDPMASPEFRAKFERGRGKLVRCYSRIGFESAPKSEGWLFRYLESPESILGRTRSQWNRSRTIRMPEIPEELEKLAN